MTVTTPPPMEPTEDLELEEPDDGFGASHGYGPGHGGPTGPGDVPACPPRPHAPVKPPFEPDDETARPSEKAP